MANWPAGLLYPAEGTWPGRRNCA